MIFSHGEDSESQPFHDSGHKILPPSPASKLGRGPQTTGPLRGE